MAVTQVPGPRSTVSYGPTSPVRLVQIVPTGTPSRQPAKNHSRPATASALRRAPLAEATSTSDQFVPLSRPTRSVVLPGVIVASAVSNTTMVSPSAATAVGYRFCWCNSGAERCSQSRPSSETNTSTVDSPSEAVTPTTTKPVEVRAMPTGSTRDVTPMTSGTSRDHVVPSSVSRIARRPRLASSRFMRNSARSLSEAPPATLASCVEVGTAGVGYQDKPSGDTAIQGIPLLPPATNMPQGVDSTELTPPG